MDRRGLKRDKYLHFRVNEAEWQALVRLCAQEQAGISETMRHALREIARLRGVWPGSAHKTEEADQ